MSSTLERIPSNGGYMFHNVTLLAVVVMLSACGASTGTTLARGASPSPVLFETFEVCVGRLVQTGLSPDNSATACLKARDQEKERAIALANAAAKAVHRYPSGSPWQGSGYYGQSYYPSQSSYYGGSGGGGTYRPYQPPRN